MCREQAQHNGKILEVSGVTEHKFPPSKATQNGGNANRSRSFIEWRKSLSQRKDKCQRSERHGNSWKFTDRIVDVPLVLKRQCQTAQVLDRAEDVPTTGAKDANVQKTVQVH